MRKLIALLLALAMLCFAGCGKEAGNPSDDEGTKAPVNTGAVQGDEQTETTEERVQSGEITMEDLLNAPESPVEDFNVIDYEEGGVYLEGYLGNDEIVVIPESLGVTHIANYIFNNDTPIRAIRFSDTVQVIGTSLFTGNNNLELVALGKGMREIGIGAFQGCSNLREIKVYDGLTTVRDSAFSSCDSLKEVYVPATVTEIEILAFFLMSDDFVIIGEAGSAAEEYANSEGITFQAK